MNRKSPKISESEFEIMKVLWGKSPQTANEIIEKLESKIEWKPKTIRTLINRLVQKEAVFFKQEKGQMYKYYPLLSQDSVIQVETKSFLKRFYGISLKPLIVNFLKEEKLSSEDINELKRILDEKSGEKQGEDKAEND